ncbi:unnamed protein product, partial [marine sediment metagenome]
MGKLVATSTSPFTTVWPAQRKTFYAAGRFWIFYSDGTNMVYCTSTDGINWTDPETIRPAWMGFRFSIWFEERDDETFLHYAYSLTSFNEPILYRRGIPNADGTITWSTVGEEEAVAGVPGVAYTYPVISVDSEGYPWIGYCLNSPATNYPYAIKSDNNNGTWTGEVPDQLSTVSGLYFVTVIPLTVGKMLAVYSRAGQKMYARRWDGLIWGSEISTINKVLSYFYFTAVAEGDDVHLVFTSRSFRLIYARYDY